ncbi:DUF3055 domain-containing protein [Aquibacillus sp. 3ASR75-11]|uniref:DUF3055 domain-containing protein n=1 Tax=Terrihalobacillus insolitus TaxID=2950438 RepID=A0A9X4AKL1_9BACI|nr:SAV0927 family protein [Terrihalobacillus insolitus]MDC3412358.1 DUF3055 domain-containing protein [Terrihalobacillus insolitus]MDC3422949.1 DUF3055 domain-containing protein [Terrihalobacillus insolitus]
MENNWTTIIDETELMKSRIVSFKGYYHRYDLIIFQSDRFKGKQLVVDLQSNRFSLLDQVTLEEEALLEHDLNYTEVEADDLRRFLRSHFSS